MKYKILTVFSFSLISLVSFSQAKNVVIADASDRSPLPYATIKVVNKNRGYYADKNGVVNILNAQPDSLLIEYVAHVSCNVVIKDIADSIFLKRKEYELLPVEIKTLNTQHELGSFKRKTFYSLFFSESSEYALKIDLSGIKDNYKVKQFFLPLDINKRTFNDCVVKLHLYKEADNGTPGEDILNKPLILGKDDLPGNNFYIDVSAQNLVLSEKYLFVGIECIIGKELNDSTLTGNKAFNQQSRNSPVSLYIAKEKQFFDGSYGHTFMRHLNSPSYQWQPEADSKNPMNISAGLVILSSQ